MLFRNALAHGARDWTDDKKKGVLESMKSGQRNNTVNEAMNWYGKEVWAYIIGEQAPPLSKRTPRRPDKCLEALCRTGAFYGISRKEFIDLCTIPSPEGRPVQYPFHPLSRAEAIPTG